jgi:hypothetical protein
MIDAILAMEMLRAMDAILEHNPHKFWKYITKIDNVLGMPNPFTDELISMRWRSGVLNITQALYDLAVEATESNDRNGFWNLIKFLNLLDVDTRELERKWYRT